MLYGYYDTVIKNSNTPMKFENQDVHDLFIETITWINLCLAKN